jgi:hypothetical protein
MLNSLHDAVTLVVIILVAYAIVSPRVPTGTMPTAGLGVIGFALVWSLDDWHQPQTTLDLIVGGLGLMGWGMVWRLVRRPRCRMRRREDWAPTTRPGELLTREQQQHVAGGRGAP